jgi:hypothetical protein
VASFGGLTGNIMTTTQQMTLIQRAIEAGHNEEDAPKVAALCIFDGCEPDEVALERHDFYGLSAYSIGNRKFAIGTDSEADSACEQYVCDSAWAFNANFILEQCGLPRELQEPIQAWQERECEGANDGILALIKKTCGIERFTQSAMSADGRGHFLSSYDGNEEQVSIASGDVYEAFYIYRTN